MKLEVIDRLVLLNLLPEKGNDVTLKLTRKLKEALSFSEKEIAQLKFTNQYECPTCKKRIKSAKIAKCEECGVYMTNLNQLFWEDKDSENLIKDIHMGRSMEELCYALLKKLNDEENLNDAQLNLYEKFKAED